MSGKTACVLVLAPVLLILAACGVAYFSARGEFRRVQIIEIGNGSRIEIWQEFPAFDVGSGLYFTISSTAYDKCYFGSAGKLKGTVDFEPIFFDNGNLAGIRSKRHPLILFVIYDKKTGLAWPLGEKGNGQAEVLIERIRKEDDRYRTTSEVRPDEWDSK